MKRRLNVAGGGYLAAGLMTFGCFGTALPGGQLAGWCVSGAGAAVLTAVVVLLATGRGEYR